MKETEIVSILKSDDLSAVKEIVGRKGVNCQDEQGQTLLMNSVVHGASLAVIEYLLDNGAKVDIKDNRGYSPLDVLEKDAREKVELHRHISFGALLCYQTDVAKVIMKMLALDASAKPYSYVRHILSRSTLGRDVQKTISYVR